MLSWCAFPVEEESLLVLYSRVVVDGFMIQASCPEFVILDGIAMLD
jgi:hypothetical protein